MEEETASLMPQTHRQAPELGFAALQYAVNCAAGGARSNHTPGRLPRGCCWRRCRRCCQPPYAPRQSNVAAAPCAFPSRTHPWRPPPPSHAAVPGTRGAACRCCWWQAPARCSSSLWLVRGTTTQGQYLPRFATQPAAAPVDAAQVAPFAITTPQLRSIASWQGAPGAAHGYTCRAAPAGPPRSARSKPEGGLPGEPNHAAVHGGTGGAAAAAAAAAGCDCGKVRVDFYGESLCPDCQVGDGGEGCSSPVVGKRALFCYHSDACFCLCSACDQPPCGPRRRM